MYSSFSRRASRFTARVMLAVWLMALGLGVANACLAQDDHARHGHLQHAGDQTPAPAKLACQLFCASGQSSVLKEQGDAPQPLAAVLLAAASWRADLRSPYRHVQWPMDDDAAPRPPDSIVFLRLTL